MQVNKNIKIFTNYFLGPVLFAWLAFSIYTQIKHQPQLEVTWQQIRASFYSVKIVYLILAMLLVLTNWGLEALKWKVLVASVQRIRLRQAFKAVLSGVTFSVTMPNRVGEYLGRVLYLPEGSRLKTISVTLVGSFAQLLTTLAAGALGLMVLKQQLLTAYPQLLFWYQFALYGLVVLISLLCLLYFNVARTVALFKRWIRNPKYIYLVEALNNFHGRILMQILLLSFLRYIVFVVQYILIFYLFEVNMPGLLIGWVMSVVFLTMAVVPSIALVEIGVRGEISLRLMSLFSSNSLGIGLTTITIWFINLILPAMAGSILLLNLKAFAKRNEIRASIKNEADGSIKRA